MTHYTDLQVDLLLNIPYIRGGGPNSSRIKELARRWKMKENRVWQKWYDLHNGRSKTGIKTNRKINKSIQPMQFKEIECSDFSQRVTEDEEISMRKGLDLAIKKTLFIKDRGIIFPKRLVNRAKKYLSEDYPSQIFSFHKYKTDKKFVILRKRV